MMSAIDEKERVPEQARESMERASNEPLVDPDSVDERPSAPSSSKQPEPDSNGRLDALLGGIPLQAKVALLAGVAAGLFADIVLSSSGIGPPYVGLGVGVGLGIAGAVAMRVRSR